MFVFFALWTLRGDTLTDDEASRAQKATAPAFFVVMSAFVLAELGDKTMLATITLAADNDWVGVWIGSTLGMVAADGLAIIVGAVAGKHLPERLIQISAAALFLLFGAYMLLENFFPADARRADRRRMCARRRRAVSPASCGRCRNGCGQPSCGRESVKIKVPKRTRLTSPQNSMRDPMTTVRSCGRWKKSAASAVRYEVAMNNRLRHGAMVGSGPASSSSFDRK